MEAKFFMRKKTCFFFRKKHKCFFRIASLHMRHISESFIYASYIGVIYICAIYRSHLYMRHISESFIYASYIGVN